MLKIDDIQGVIFDVDETLLDNYPPHIPYGLHEQSRVRAAHTVGKRHGIKALQEFTDEQAYQAFRDAPVHSLHGAVWQTLKMIGEVQGELDLTHPLLIEMVTLKDELHGETLRMHGKEVPGATQFIEKLVEYGLRDKLAIASTAYRRDILVFFDMANLHRFFPDKRIITRELFTHPKPHPESFEMAFKTLGLKSKSKVIAFEDDPRGIMSAKAAGLYTCAITTRFKKEDLADLAVPPDFIGESYAEFEKSLGL
jgi:beta-phosphoglucomutase-like phosphatase (HAD superfamily)